MKVLITGCAGFIGYHLSIFLLKKKINVFGIDNLNEYYDVKLKKNRLKNINNYKNFTFHKLDLLNIKKLNNIIKKNKIKIVVHLAAQAGVRYSIENPESYLKNNLEGFFNILEVSKQNNIKHLVFASTSSVYGENNNFPLKENDNTNKPISFYAATKKSNEVMAHSYSYIFKLPCTALRFFTVYGPYGRPDMALFKFTKNILENKKIELFNNGNHNRDFTFVDDIVEGIYSVINKPNKKKIPFNTFNIGNGKSRKLIDYLSLIEKKLGRKAKIKNLPLQKGDIVKTHASISLLKNFTNYKPRVDIEEGVEKFIDWFVKYYKY